MKNRANHHDDPTAGAHDGHATAAGVWAADRTVVATAGGLSGLLLLLTQRLEAALV